MFEAGDRGKGQQEDLPIDAKVENREHDLQLLSSVLDKKTNLLTSITKYLSLGSHGNTSILWCP